jgi:hypothetical protein
MPPMTPDQVRSRRRVESLIRVMAPALDLVLAAGDRISRVVEPEDVEYYPPRVTRGPKPARPAAQGWASPEQSSVSEKKTHERT